MIIRLNMLCVRAGNMYIYVEREKDMTCKLVNRDGLDARLNGEGVIVHFGGLH